MKTIWTYWEDRPGSQPPPHILLCRNILAYQCKKSTIQLITPENVNNFLPELNPNVWKINMSDPKHNPIAVRCAFIRAFLLEKYGGLYVDSDCIALTDFASVFESFDKFDFLTMRRTSAKTRHISIGFYASKKNGVIISEYAKQLRSILNVKTKFKWGEVGAHLLTPIVDAHLDKVELLREDQIHPIVAEKQYKFCDKELNPPDVIPNDAICFMLYHRIFKTNVKNVTLKDCSATVLYKSNMLISKVFRKVFPEREFMNHFSKTDSKQSKTMRKKLQAPSLSLQKDSDKVLELTHYWTPLVPTWKPLKKSPNTSLRIACVVENRLYEGLRFEGELILMTPYNWKRVLSYGKPDFLLMESIWTTATGHWHMGQCPAAPKRDELLEIVSLARQHSIPTVYWITKGHEYHEHYKDFARHFDYVFCADPIESQLLRDEGVQSEVLLPCVQPALYNPFRLHEYYDAFNLDILYDGWADLDRMTDDLSVLKEVKPYGLSIFESRYHIFRRRIDSLPDYKDCILGCVTPQSRILAMKYAKAYITFNKTLSTQTTQQWMSLEAAASRMPVVHHGTLTDGDMRKDIVIECPEQMEFLVELVRFREDDLYRERVAHLGWRATYQKHSFAHRVKEICIKIDKKNDWTEYPKASLITPTYRQDMLPRCLDTFERQTYPNKELILIFNGKGVPSHRKLGLDKPRSDVQIANVPGDMFAGACLNYGQLLATGEYLFRVDDDDLYGPNYILDMILQARSIDADFFSKPPAPVYFEDDQTIYARKSTYPLSIFSKSLLNNGKLWLGGNSISGSKRFFQKTHYQESEYGAADTSLMYSLGSDAIKVCSFMDGMNLLVERRVDQSTHTWRNNEEKLKLKCNKLLNIEEVIL